MRAQGVQEAPKKASRRPQVGPNGAPCATQEESKWSATRASRLWGTRAPGSPQHVTQRPLDQPPGLLEEARKSFNGSRDARKKAPERPQDGPKKAPCAIREETKCSAPRA